MIDFILGMICGWMLANAVQYIIMAAKHRHVREEVTKMVEEVRQNIIVVDVESQDGTWYVYNSQTKQYLASGPTIGSISRTLEERYPEKTFLVKNRDGVTHEPL